MTLEEVMERITIEFPEHIPLNQMIELLDYICDTMPAGVSYQVHYFAQKQGKEKRSRGSGSIAGQIRHNEKLASFDCFETVQSDKDYTLVGGMRFAMIPDYELSEYRPEAIQLWDDIRERVDYYFSHDWIRVPRD
jgi:hypothetical protein